MTKNTRLALNLLMIVVGMSGLAWATVPLYRLFCQVTGFQGTTQVAKKIPEKSQISDRVITIRFNADVDPTLGWEFKPEQNAIQVHVGENGLAYFEATNKSGVVKEAKAIYNVTPEKVGGYFNKVYCFCFDRQMLKPGEHVEYPVSFFVDPEFAKDHYMDDVDTITLSYTFYEYDKAPGEAK